MKYPSDWFGGKTRGSLAIRGNTYFARINVAGKTLSKYFKYSPSDNADKALQQKIANDWFIEISDANNLTQNKIRYIDEHTIEVKLDTDDNKTFVTDAKYIDLVEKYKLHLKTKKNKNGTEKQYVLYQEKKIADVFANLISGYKPTSYKDSNTFNLRYSNLKKFGEIAIHRTDNDDDQYKYFEENNVCMLPKNKWILGKPSGTIFKRANDDQCYVARITDSDDKQHTKTFSISDYGSDENAYKEAKKWKIISSYKLNETKNMIKIINDEYMEVKLSKDCIMLTDLVFLPLIQKVNLCASKSGNENAKYYSLVCVDNESILYHNLITGFKLVDHINRNPLDDRLINLRYADHSENNRNKSNSELHRLHLVNVMSTKRQYYESSVKFGNLVIKKQFYVDKYEDGEAMRLAQMFRRNLCKINVNTCRLEFTGTETRKIIRFMKKYNEAIEQDTIANIVFDRTLYMNKLGDIGITQSQKSKMHIKYLYIQIWRLQNFSIKIKNMNGSIDNISVGKRPINETVHNNMLYGTDKIFAFGS